MTPVWHFREQRPDEKIRNPIQGELFSDDAIDKPAQALVREAIQNSLDARPKEAAAAVTVRFYLSGEDKALPSNRAKLWFDGVWEHLRAPSNGLGEVAPHPLDCPFLVVEDFGTTGLEGDPREWQPPKRNNDNRFFAFFRAEGVSISGGGGVKSGQQGGRWGVGKTVFPRSSKINTSFGLTVRRDDGKKLMLGQTTLFYHDVKGTPYAPDGYYGNAEKDQLVMPVEDAHILKQFERDFVIQRGDEPGLTVVIPYVDEHIAPADLACAVIREYFQPILLGRLIVRINSPGAGPFELSAKTLQEKMQTFGSKLDAGLRSAVELAIWARDSGADHRVILNDPGLAPIWSPKMVPPEMADKLAQSYNAGERLAIRVPLRIRQKNRPTRDSFFDVYIQRAGENDSYLPFYIRNGIMIPKVRERQVRGHRLLSLLLVDDEAIAALLGDAEPPAHTHWSKSTQRFEQAQYTDGPEVLDFVSDAPRQLAELLSRQQQEKDEFLLADLFPRPELDGIETQNGRNKKGGGTVVKPPLPTPRPQPFEVREFVGGFRVVRDAAVAPAPALCKLAVAYDTSRGSPLGRYKLPDFKLADLNVDVMHGKELKRGNNTLDIAVTDDRFEVTVTGFDPNRDLYVQVRGGDD